MNFSRREFLQTTTTALATSVFGEQLFAVESKPKRALQKAMMFGTIGFPGTVLEKFRAIKAAGFDGVEPMSHMNQDEVLNALQETGLKAASVCCSTHWKKESSLSSADPEARAKGVEGVKQALRDAKHYGASSILLVPGTVRDEVTYEECWQRSIAEIRKVLPECEQTGVKIAVENVWNNFIMKPEQAKEYLDEINSPLVGWHFDIGNMIRYCPSEEWINVLGNRILKLHIKEYAAKPDANGKAPGFNVKLLEGDNHWPEIMAALDKHGYSGWAITEQPAAQTKDAELLKEFSERLDRVLAS
jgi:hexulose-6-phosphate isomerase